MHKVQNENISLTLELDNGISLTSIFDKVNGHEFLIAPSPLFKVSIDDGWDYYSDTSNMSGIAGVIVDEAIVSGHGGGLTIECHINDRFPIAFTLDLHTSTDDAAIRIGTCITNNGTKPVKVKYVNPCIRNLAVPGQKSDSGRLMGMVPQEIGGVAQLKNNSVLGMTNIDYTSGLPNAMNIMQVANIYDRDGGGGLFFADVDNLNTPSIPIQFILSKNEVSGLWMTGSVKAGESVKTPDLAIGVNHSGDYKDAIDYYLAANNNKFENGLCTPKWFSEAGGIWHTGDRGSGPFIASDLVDLNKQITSFDELPILYDKATAAGTNIFFLSDYWEGEQAGTPRWWCKGDYIPRADLGGEEAIKRGIKGIHDKGGKVIMYLNPLLVQYGAKLAEKNGMQWCARYPGKTMYFLDLISYTMLPTHEAWRDYLVSTVKRLVGDYKADGIYLDYFGWKFNVANLKNFSENIKYSFEEWNNGTYSLADLIRRTVTEINEDGVVMCESPSGDLWRHVDAGYSSDFSRSGPQNAFSIRSSPVRYGMPAVRFFSAGHTMNQMAQIYASGSGLALNCIFDDNASFIKKLMDIRKRCIDAFLYGKQIQFANYDESIAAYCYMGKNNSVITIVNFTDETKKVTLNLSPDLKDSVWKDPMNEDTVKTSADVLEAEVEGMSSSCFGLKILIKADNLST